MRGEAERVLAEVMRAVNRAPDGSWVDASEMPVRDAFAGLRRVAYERALQMRADAAGGDFSPSAGGRGQGGGGS
jgi:hypothetical protein